MKNASDRDQVPSTSPAWQSSSRRPRRPPGLAPKPHRYTHSNQTAGRATPRHIPGHGAAPAHRAVSVAKHVIFYKPVRHGIVISKFFIKEGCRPGSTSQTLSFYHLNEAETASVWSWLRLEDSTVTMKHERFEIEPRPAAVGGGWRLRLIGHDLETGDEIELGGGVFPVEPGDERDAYADAMETGQEWLDEDSRN